ALEVAVGRDQDPVGARDRLDDESGDRPRALETDRLLEKVQSYLSGVRSALDAVVRVEKVDHTDRMLVRPAERVSGRLDGGAGRAVVRAIPGDDLAAARTRPSDLDSVLVGAVARRCALD